MLEPIEKLFDEFRDLGLFARDLVTWVTAFGIVVLLIINIKYLIAISSGIKLYFIDQYFSSSCCQIDLAETYGKWAVISGATDGIGLALAKELAGKGMSLIIIGRNELKLANTKEQLEREQNVGEVVTIKKDFSDSSLESYRNLARKVKPMEREIGILINNVGTFFPKFNGFENEDEESLKVSIDVNILSHVMLTRIVIPSMLQRKGGTGLVVNVSSILASVNYPFFGVYASAKGFVSSFSKQLKYEYRNCRNLKIVNLTTGPVNTKPYEISSTFGNQRAGTDSAFSAFSSPRNYARSVLNILSSRCHPHEFSGYPSHGLLKCGYQFLDGLGLLAPISERAFFRKKN